MNSFEFIIIDRETDKFSKMLGEMERRDELTILSKNEFSSVGIFLRTDRDILQYIPEAKRGTFEDFSKIVMASMK